MNMQYKKSRLLAAKYHLFNFCVRLMVHIARVLE